MEKFQDCLAITPQKPLITTFSLSHSTNPKMSTPFEPSSTLNSSFPHYKLSQFSHNFSRIVWILMKLVCSTYTDYGRNFSFIHFHFVSNFQHSKTLFIPYLIFDAFFLTVTIILGIVGTFFRLTISKLCVFFFFVKLYSSLCAFSLYKDYRSRRKKASDRISIHSAASQHLTAIDADDDDENPRNAGLGEAPLAVAV